VSREIYIYFFAEQQPKSGLQQPTTEVSRSHTIRHTHTIGPTHSHTPPRTPLRERATHRWGRYLHNTQQTQATGTNSLSGIRTRDPSNRTAANLFSRPHGQRDRREFHLDMYKSLKTDRQTSHLEPKMYTKNIKFWQHTYFILTWFYSDRDKLCQVCQLLITLNKLPTHTNIYLESNERWDYILSEHITTPLLYFTHLCPERFRNKPSR
jgi:hypothetical protein